MRFAVRTPNAPLTTPRVTSGRAKATVAEGRTLVIQAGGLDVIPPYYHNGACETFACVLTKVRHRTAEDTRPGVLANPADQAAVVAFLESIDVKTPSVAPRGDAHRPGGTA